MTRDKRERQREEGWFPDLLVAKSRMSPFPCFEIINHSLCSNRLPSQEHLNENDGFAFSWETGTGTTYFHLSGSIAWPAVRRNDRRRSEGEENDKGQKGTAEKRGLVS